MTRPLKARSPQAAGLFFFTWDRSPAGAAALCVNSHNLPGRDVLSLRSSRLSRRFLPRLGPSRMAGSFAARVASRHGVAPVDVLIAVKLLYLDDLVLTPINGSFGPINGSFGPLFPEAHRAVQPRHHSRREHPSVEYDQ